MLASSTAFSGFSIRDSAATKAFYADKLGLDVRENDMGFLELHLKGAGTVLAYVKEDHEPASFTILNFPVPDIDEAVDWLVEQGVTLERYEGMGQDDRGVLRGSASDQGPDIAWFLDPSGNVLSVLSE